MSLISFVVPVHNVHGFLRRCLDSVLDQAFTDIDVVAVDDASTDGSAAVLAEFAALDHRVTVLTLDRNEGPGPARNRGLQAATGAYVWFLDGDDWLADGVVGAVAERIRETDADVVVVDHVRCGWDGAVVPSVTGTRFRAAPRVFALHEWPETIEILHVPWNKVVRRTLAARFPFGHGWYEDVPYTYGLLMAADRITLLDRVGVHYRQRRAGAATATAGGGHFAIFPNWSRVFDTFDDARPGAQALRGLLFRRMIWHFLMVRGNDGRLPEELRAEFFAEMTAHYRRYVPAEGYPRPAGVDGIKHRLVASGTYRAYRVLWRGFHVAGAAAAATRTVAVAGARAGTFGVRAGRAAALRGFYRAEVRRPRDPGLALYAAYWYRGYACNPAAVYEKARDLVPAVRGVWVVRRDRVASLPAGVPYVVAGTAAYHRALARATWLVNNVNWPDHVVKRAGSTHLMTHHGTPVKVMGLDQRDYPGGVRDPDFVGQMRRADRWDYSVTANAFTTRAWATAYPCRYVTLETGYPRNDRLARADAAQTDRVRAALGLPPEARVLLYAPTHREHLPSYRPPFDAARLLEAAGPDSVLLVRDHYFADRAAPPDRRGGDRVVDVSAHPVVEDLYLAADVLITDYSSAMFDYAVLDRPIVVYAPDWEAYRLVRGVYFDLLAEPPGVTARTFADLLDAFRDGAVAGDAATKARAEFRTRFCALDDGRAAERVVRRVFLGEA